jgi:hypothetical protein
MQFLFITKFIKYSTKKYSQKLFLLPTQMHLCIKLENIIQFHLAHDKSENKQPYHAFFMIECIFDVMTVWWKITAFTFHLDIRKLYLSAAGVVFIIFTNYKFITACFQSWGVVGFSGNNLHAAGFHLRHDFKIFLNLNMNNMINMNI